MKREADLKARLMKELRAALPHFVCQRHEDRFVAGWPDITITGNRRTSHWEAKHATPRITSTGIQELTMQRLAQASFHARYIIWYEKDDVKSTIILHPRNITALEPADEWCDGFNMKWLVEYIERIHSV
jgi:hypothetical protein